MGIQFVYVRVASMVLTELISICQKNEGYFENVSIYEWYSNGWKEVSRKLHKQYQDINRNNNYEVIYNCEIDIIGMELLYHIYTRSKFTHDV